MDDMLNHILKIAENSCVTDARINKLFDEYYRITTAKRQEPTAESVKARDKTEPALLMPGVLIYLGGKVIITQDAPGSRYTVSSEGAKDTTYQSIYEAKVDAKSRVSSLIEMGWAE